MSFSSRILVAFLRLGVTGSVPPRSRGRRSGSGAARTRSDAALVLAALSLCAGCAAADWPGEPSPLRVEPAAGFTTVETIVEIAGEGFHLKGVQEVDGGSVVDTRYRAWLGATELLEVAWLDARTLLARAPAGLAPGWHEVVVEGPYGRGSLEDAYLAVEGLPGAVAVSLAIPARVTVGDEVQVSVTAENQGTWLVEGVAPALSLAGGGALEPVAAGAAPEDLVAGGKHEFVLRYVATRPGELSVSVSVAGTDPRTGAAVSAETLKPILVRPVPSVTVVADDPFADGSAFAFVAGYRGQVLVGPNRTGTGLVRMDPDGTALESLALSFARDTIGNQSSNSASPYRSIGFTGCAANSLVNACGPDNENGRGFMTSLDFAGDEWLVLGGARSGGDLDYVYMSRSGASPLAFSYVDLSAVLGGNTRGFSAASAAGGRLYLGFPDNGGNRPYGIALLAPPPAPGGLDALAGTHVLDLNLHDVYAAAYGKFSSVSMVDAIAELGDRLYFFNNSGCVAAKSLAPTSKADFTACSPADGAAYAQADSIEPTRQHDLEPWERAWPAAAVWKGRLFAIRNTKDGPQLWRCDPAAGTDPSACDRSDWTLVAANSSLRTRFGRPDAVATLLLATEWDLWIGFDGPQSGIGLFRTSAAVPAVASDFMGKDGCSAGAPGCEGIGGDGFGAPAALRRIFDAKAIDWSGGTDLVLAVGDGTGPVRIVRVAP
jgi:hypothetical protein